MSDILDKAGDAFGSAGRFLAKQGPRAIGWAFGAAFWLPGRPIVAALPAPLRGFAPYFIDYKINRKLCAAIWPSVLILVIVLALSASSGPIFTSHAAKMLAGFSLVFAFGWGLISGALALFAIIPYLFRWIISPRLPKQFFEDELARSLENWYAQGTGDWSNLVRGMLEGADLTPQKFAAIIAEAVTGILIRHLLLRFFLMIAPMLVALAYWRYVMLPNIVNQGFGHSPMSLALWAVLSAFDGAFGTQHAAMVLHR